MEVSAHSPLEVEGEPRVSAEIGEPVPFETRSTGDVELAVEVVEGPVPNTFRDKAVCRGELR